MERGPKIGAQCKVKTGDGASEKESGIAKVTSDKPFLITRSEFADESKLFTRIELFAVHIHFYPVQKKIILLISILWQNIYSAWTQERYTKKNTLFYRQTKSWIYCSMMFIWVIRSVDEMALHTDVVVVLFVVRRVVIDVVRVQQYLGSVYRQVNLYQRGRELIIPAVSWKDEPNIQVKTAFEVTQSKNRTICKIYIDDGRKIH